MRRFRSAAIGFAIFAAVGVRSAAYAQVQVGATQTFTSAGVDALTTQSAACNSGTLQVSGTGSWVVVPQGSNDNGATYVTIPTIGNGIITSSGTFSGSLTGFASSFFRFSVTAVNGSVTVTKSCNSQTSLAYSPTSPLPAIILNTAAFPTTFSTIGTATFTSYQVSVTTTATLLAAARTGVAGIGRYTFTVNNSSASAIYIGGSGVTSTTGLIVSAGTSVTLLTTAAIYGITSSGTATVSGYELY